MKIFVDLDETLIHSIVVKNSNNHNRTYVKFTDRMYGIIKRRSAPLLLELIREIDPDPIMITTADYEWAHYCNTEFGFNFNTVYSRDDFTCVKSDNPYARSIVDWNEKSLGLDDAVIIDNYPWSLPSPEHKMMFVFGKVDQHRWFQINEYNGHISKDFVKTDELHIRTLMNRVKLLSETI